VEVLTGRGAGYPFDPSQAGTWNAVKTHTFVYDGWNLVLETVAYADGSVDKIEYVWGLDLSGTLQGAGGVGGLLFEVRNGQIFIPCYDANGNVTAYVDAYGNVRGQYIYDVFGNTVSQTGDMADVFHFRFSTKYWDEETRSYYYGYRHYAPKLGCWLNKDPIGKEGGLNEYGFAGNDPVNAIDYLGLKSSVTIKELPVVYTDYPLPNFAGDTFDSGRVTYFPQPPTHRIKCSCNKKTGKYELDLTISITLETKIPGPEAKHPQTGKKRTPEGIKNSESHEALHRKALVDLFRRVEASYVPLLATTWSTRFECEKVVAPIRNQNELRIKLGLRMEEYHAGQHWADWFKEHGKTPIW
jgi:RHS repeat-associated protein